jgi:hypothetical protein
MNLVAKEGSQINGFVSSGFVPVASISTNEFI